MDRRTGRIAGPITRLQGLIAVLALTTLAVDAALEQGVASGVLYVAVVGLTAWTPGMRSTLVAGVAAAMLILLGYFVSRPGGELWKELANRLFAVFAILVAMALVWHHKRQNALRDQTDERAARSERQLRQLIEANPAGMLMVDRKGRIRLVNLETTRLFGYPSEELLGQPIEVLVPELDRDEHAQHVAAFVAETRPRRMGSGREVVGLSKNGGTLNLEIGLAQIETQDGACVLATVIDVSDRKRADEARGAQALARALLDAQEAQRRRIARDIHDALGQALTALKLDIGWLAKRLSQGPRNLHERAVAMEELTTQTIHEVRRLSAELRPAILDDQGLLAAVRWQVRDFERRSGLHCVLALPAAEIAWDAERCTVAFRVLQESLTNVARHAQARKVSVALWSEQQGDAVLEVRDDGCGISADQAMAPDALGLLGMRERAALYGGALTVTGVAGAGTTVTLRMPSGPDEPPARTWRQSGRGACEPHAATEMI